MQNSLLFINMHSIACAVVMTDLQQPGLLFQGAEPFCINLVIFAVLLQIQQGLVDILGQRAVFLQGQAVGLSFHGVAYDLGLVFAAAGSQEVFRYGLIDDNRFHALVL